MCVCVCVSVCVSLRVRGYLGLSQNLEAGGKDWREFRARLVSQEKGVETKDGAEAEVFIRNNVSIKWF